MADEVNELIDRERIDLVFPGCPKSARSFCGIQPMLKAKAFPGPTLELFDLLNNKQEFARLCGELGILHPETVVVASKEELLNGGHLDRMGTPVMCKPLSSAGQEGVVKLTRDNLAADLLRINYAPILVQKFVEGEEIGTGVYCRDGEIIMFIAHRFSKGVYKTFEAPDIRKSIEKLALTFQLNGVYNFDLIVDKNGQAQFLECNPRFYFKMLLSHAAGLNFAAPGILADTTSLPQTIGNTTTRLPRGWPRMLLTPWTITRTDVAMARTLLGDPVKSLREIVRLDWV